MSNSPKSLNDTAWEQLFAKYDIVNQIAANGQFQLWQYAAGKDDTPVMHKDFVSPIKSVGHGITCIADLLNEEEVWKVMLELSQQ